MLLLADMIARTLGKLIRQAARVHCFDSTPEVMQREPNYRDIVNISACLQSLDNAPPSLKSRLSVSFNDGTVPQRLASQSAIGSNYNSRQSLAVLRFKHIVVAYLNAAIPVSEFAMEADSHEFKVTFWEFLREEVQKRFANAFSEEELHMPAIDLQQMLDFRQILETLQWSLCITIRPKFGDVWLNFYLNAR